MQTIIKSESRGIADHGWLLSRFSFSFADYVDRQRMRFGALRVLNDDVVQPGSGFGMHPHENMEIISIPLAGALEHRDSMNNGGVIRPGSMQYLSAGTGVRHSEFNPSDEEVAQFLQIWLYPNSKNDPPLYATKSWHDDALVNQWLMLASPDGRHESVAIRQNAFLRLGRFDQKEKTAIQMQHHAHGLYIFVIEGQIRAAGEVLRRRDALAITDVESVEIEPIENSYLLALEVPMVF